MFGAIDNPVITVRTCTGLHTTQIRAGTGLGHCHTIPLLSPHTGVEIFFSLRLSAGAENIGRPRNPRPVQCIVRLTQFFFIQKPGQGIQPGAAKCLRYVGRIETRFNRFGLNLFDHIQIELTGFFYVGFMRIELVFNKGSCGFYDQLLFFSQTKLHWAPCGYIFSKCRIKRGPPASVTRTDSTAAAMSVAHGQGP